MKEKNYKNILIDVRGGLGKNLALTNLIPELKEKYEHVSVISPYFDVFQACPFIDMAYKPQDVKSAFEDAFDDTLIVVDHIYDTDAFIRKEINYSDAFRLLCGLKSKNEKVSSTKSNLEPLKAFPQLGAIKDQILKTLEEKGYKDFVIAQFTGGQSPLIQVPANEKGEPDWGKVPYNGQQSGLSRHYPLDKATEFIDLFRATHPDTAVINYSLPNEYNIPATEKFIVPYLLYLLLAEEPNCKGMIGIDSSLQHLLAGKVKGVVLWHHSEPQAFGYDCFENLVADCHRDGIKYFSALGPASNRIDYISPEKLLEAVDKVLFDTEEKDESHSENNN